jgi:predicted acylesterase/phospholipase RssA/CRP-like cAMP-binding protein
VTVSLLARNPLFEHVDEEALRELSWTLRPRRFEPGEALCRAGEPGDSLFLIADGLARVVVVGEDGTTSTVARLRRGDVIGEMSLLTGEPRSATVVAVTRASALELGQGEFASLIARHPHILANLTKILSRRLAETTARATDGSTRGEAVLLLAGPMTASLVPDVLEAAEAASAAGVASLDARLSVAEPLGALDDLLADRRTVVLVGDLGASETLPALVESADRTVALVGGEEELRPLAAALERVEGDVRIEVVLLAGSAQERDALARLAGGRMRVVRGLATGATLPPSERAWLGRHLARTKLGLALGAGGAKGYAHIGALAVLTEAGYAVDCVAGSSIGAIVGAWLGLGMSVAELEETMRYGFRPEVVADIFKLSMSGRSSGLETMEQMLRETTCERTFADLAYPLVVMTVDLNARAPAPVTEGPLWEALLAATAVAGLFPPYERDGQRLVDGLALVPVPTDAAAAAGADIVLSVNLMSRDTLAAWPGEVPPEPAEARTGGSRLLETILEVMDLAQLDSSERHAARADVVVTPRFGPGSWRDFHLGDLFFAAGRLAMEEQLPALAALARPGRAARSRR